jgi:hypothetical protein
LRCAVHHGQKRLLEIFNHIGLHFAQEFHAPESFPAIFASRGLQLESNVIHVLLWALGWGGLLALALRRWRNGDGTAIHAVGIVSLPILFLKRRGPHNWYLALTSETRSVAAITLASALMNFMSPACNSVSATCLRQLLVTAALATPLGGWEVVLAPTFGWLAQIAFRWCTGRESDWSMRHIACIVGAVPVGLAALALQDVLLTKIMRVSQHDVTPARLPFRLQHTLQLLFNGALCSAADVRHHMHSHFTRFFSF